MNDINSNFPLEKEPAIGVVLPQTTILGILPPETLHSFTPIARIYFGSFAAAKDPDTPFPYLFQCCDCGWACLAAEIDDAVFEFLQHSVRLCQ